MWAFEHTETTDATPAQLWRWYCEPQTWPQWDHDTTEVTVDGPFAVGTTGTITPRSGPRAAFTFTEVTAEVSFTDTTRLPLATMTFTHVIGPGPDGRTSLTHGVTIRGLLAPLFGRVIGTGIARGLPGSMQRLARLAGAEVPRPAP